jgi:queuosine precursor transporter
MQPKYIIALYLSAIVAANLLVAAFGPAISILNAFLFIALDLTARDRLHEAWKGQGLIWKMALLIATGSILSYLLNASVGPIALASFVAFGVAATLDALCYHALRERDYLVKVNGSNVVSAAADSLIFPLLAFGLPLLWPVVLGQFIAKVFGGFLWAWMFRAKSVALAID